MLFLKNRECEEVLFKFSKSQKILVHSFCYGDDFNFMVCTNNMISLYEIHLSKQKIKKVKEIPIIMQDERIIGCYYEPMANVVCIVDSRAKVTVFFLSAHNIKTSKSYISKVSTFFNLDITVFDNPSHDPAQVNSETP